MLLFKNIIIRIYSIRYRFIKYTIMYNITINGYSRYRFYLRHNYQ